jgi:hypothetical protein
MNTNPEAPSARVTTPVETEQERAGKNAESNSSSTPIKTQISFVHILTTVSASKSTTKISPTTTNKITTDATTITGVPVVTATTLKVDDKTCLPGSLLWPTLLILLINLAVAAVWISKTLRKQRRSVSMGVELRQKKGSVGGTFTPDVKLAKVDEDAGVCVEKVEALNLTEAEKHEKKASVVTETLDSLNVEKEGDLENSKRKMTKKDSLESLTAEMFDSMISIEDGDSKIIELLNDEKINKKASLGIELLDTVIAIEEGNLKNV